MSWWFVIRKWGINPKYPEIQISEPSAHDRFSSWEKRNWNTDQELAVVEKYHHILDGWIERRVSYIPGFYIIKTSNLSSGYNGYICDISMKHETFHVVKCWPHLRAWHVIWKMTKREHERGNEKQSPTVKNTMHLDKVNANAPPIFWTTQICWVYQRSMISQNKSEQSRKYALACSWSDNLIRWRNNSWLPVHRSNRWWPTRLKSESANRTDLRDFPDVI